MKSLDTLTIKIFADGADLDVIRTLAGHPLVKGFTTNPTVMRKADVDDYEAFAKAVLAAVDGQPVSFEVFADDFDTMERQARKIATWGDNVTVKIPVTNTKREFSGPLITRLTEAGVQVNVTAILTLDQVRKVAAALALAPETPAVVSVFAGRIADTGRDPVPVMREALSLLESKPKAELLWASSREILNVFQADAIGCHIITVTRDVLGKLSLIGKDLAEYSLETVKMFHDDAAGAGYAIKT